MFNVFNVLNKGVGKINYYTDNLNRNNILLCYMSSDSVHWLQYRMN